MKKYLLCIFSFLFIGTALIGSAFLLAGCESSYSQDNLDNENNIENGNNQPDDEFSVPEDNENDENDEVSAKYTTVDGISFTIRINSQFIISILLKRKTGDACYFLFGSIFVFPPMYG